MNDIMGLISDNLHNENLEIAYVNKSDENTAKKINKNDFLQQTKINLRMKEICSLLSELTWYERFEWVHQKKLKGNRFIKKNKIEEAESTYMEAMMGLDFKNGTPKENTRVINELQIPLVMNLGSCSLKKKQYEKSIQLYTKGIKINPTYYKLFLKRAYASSCLKEYENARDDFNFAYKLANDDTERNDVKEAFEEFKTQKENDAKVLKKYFNGTSHQSETAKIEQMNGDLNEQEEDEKEETLLCYNDDWEDLQKFKLLRWPLYISQQVYGFFKNRLFNCCRRDTPSDFNRNILKSIYSKSSEYLYGLVSNDEE